MPSPEPEDAPRTPRIKFALRALGAIAFAVVGVAVVWQAYGVAGYGTDDHPLRNFVAFVPLCVAGWVLLRPGTKVPLRAGAVLLGLGVTVAAWWLVPSSSGGMSLRDAVARREQLRSRLASPSLEDMESGIVTKLKIDSLRYEYRDLSRPLEADMKRWVDAVTAAIVARYQQIPPEDVATGRAFEERARKFSIQFSGDLAIYLASGDWVARAIAAMTQELENVPRGDWARFNRTADGRHILATTGYAMLADENREALMKAEAAWVNESVEGEIEVALATSGAKGTRASVWRDIEREVLALQSLDTGEERFKAARQRLFDLGHASAWHEINQHLKAGRVNRAFGIARTHAVEWNATATMLGPGEVEKLDALRDKCAALVKPDSPDPEPAGGIDVAPPPRPKPEK